MRDDHLVRAQALYDSGSFESSTDVAAQGLATRPDDPNLLRVAGRASLEAGSVAAVDYLARLVALEPDDAQGWHELGEALMLQGRVPEATDAFRKAARLRPDDWR